MNILESMGNNMKLLIDGSLNYLELLLINENNKVARSFFVLQNKNLTDILVNSVDEFLQKNNVDKNMIHELLIVNGPGSFTSIKLVSVFANTWKQFYPSVTLKQINTCLWNSVSKNQVNILDAKSNFYYLNNSNTSITNDIHKVDLISKEEFNSLAQYKAEKVNIIKDVLNPIFKWEFNKNNFIKVNRIIPNYVKPAV